MQPDGGQGYYKASVRSAAAGEIVEVPGGGRIVRSAAGRKDRHSKVCTAKGTRDRRVRLAAHTAIQFYDIQDRLGYDRPSKAVDWLMTKAKSAIDALDELPAWNPVTKTPDGDTAPATEADVYDGNLLPPSMESDSIADTIKSFFPVTNEGSATSMQFQSYQSSDLLTMRDSNQSQDLKLSLQSLQEPMMIQSHPHHHHHHHHNNNNNNPPHSHQGQEEEEQQQSQFPGAAHIEFVNPSAGWDSTDSGHLIGWNLGGYCGAGNGGGGFMLIPPPLQQNHQMLFNNGGHNSSHLFTNGDSLQSSFITPLATANSSQVHHHNHHHDQSVTIHPLSFPSIGLGSSGAFSGFCIPARIQGCEDEQDGNPKPFSLSSSSRH